MKRCFRENDYSGYSIRDRVVNELRDLHDTADLRVKEKERLQDVINGFEYAKSNYDYKEALRLADELADDMSEVFTDEAQAIWDAVAEIRQGLELNAKELEESDDRLTASQLKWTDKVSYSIDEAWDEINQNYGFTIAGGPYRSLCHEFANAGWYLESAETVSDVKEAIDSFNIAIDKLDRLNNCEYEDDAEYLRSLLVPIYDNILITKKSL